MDIDSKTNMKEIKLGEKYLARPIEELDDCYVSFSEEAMRLEYDSTENVNAMRDAYKACIDTMNEVVSAMDKYKEARKHWDQTEKEVYRRMAEVRRPEEEKYRQGHPHRLAESAQEYAEIAALYKLYHETREMFTHNYAWRF